MYKSGVEETSKMIDYSLVERLSDGMKKSLQLELEAGNEIKEIYQGGFRK